MLKRKHRGRIRLRGLDRVILGWLSQMGPAVVDAIIIVKPDTLVRWHRLGLRAFWRWQKIHQSIDPFSIKATSSPTLTSPVSIMNTPGRGKWKGHPSIFLVIPPDHDRLEAATGAGAGGPFVAADGAWDLIARMDEDWLAFVGPAQPAVG